MRIEITKEQQQSLLGILNNISIKGQDVNAFIALFDAVSHPIQEEPKEVVIKHDKRKDE